MLLTRCACCGHKYLIEGGEQEGINEDELIVNLSCPNCNAEVYYVINEKCLNSEIEGE